MHKLNIDEEKLKERIEIPDGFCGLRALSKVSTPSFWDEFVRRFSLRLSSMSKFFVVDNVSFYFGTAEDLLTDFKSKEPEIEQHFIKIMHYFVYEDNKGRDRCKWVIAEDGTPFRKRNDELLFMTAVPPKRRYQQQMDFVVPMLDIEGHPLHKSEWNDLHHFVLSVEQLTIGKWKEERRAFVKEAKESGAIQKYKDGRKARRVMERTKRKMNTVSQARTVIQELERYITDIENDTATQEQVGDLYRSMSDLISLNKRVKTLFPKK